MILLQLRQTIPRDVTLQKSHMDHAARRVIKAIINYNKLLTAVNITCSLVAGFPTEDTVTLSKNHFYLLKP